MSIDLLAALEASLKPNQCDQCGRLTRGNPKGWISDQYTGRVLCPSCVDVELERSRERALGEGT